MEENILVITEEIHTRLKKLMACKDLGAPPKALRENRPNVVLIGRATKEQQAIALLYNEVNRAHERMHRIEKLPFGINPYVSFDHYRKHVMIPILFEMLMWSVHRAYPQQTTDLSLLFDAKWNMYAPLRRHSRKKKRK